MSAKNLNLDLNLEKLNEKEMRKSLDFLQISLLGISETELVKNHLIAEYMFNKTKKRKRPHGSIVRHWEKALNDSTDVLKARKPDVMKSLNSVECDSLYVKEKIIEIKSFLEAYKSPLEKH